MISLVPPWAHHYDAFWDAIRRRNLWFIKLRYGAVAMLTTLLLSAEYLLGFEFKPGQQRMIFVITGVILIYNIILHAVRKYLKCSPGKFNPLHFSVLQMLLDLTALMLLVFYTGGIETPLYMLFVFHMIIGSLILPGAVVFLMAGFTILAFSALVFAVYAGILPHYQLTGLTEFNLHNNINYIAAVLSIFSFMVLTSVLLANRIAKQLYKMEQDLVETIEKLGAAEEEKQKYIMGIVHEIKTPIAAVHSFLDLVLQKFMGPVDEKIEIKLTRAKIRTDEAIEMINQVLKISQMRLLEEIRTEDIHVEKIIQHLIKKHGVNVEIKNITLRLYDKRDVKKVFLGDYFLIEIAFSNLIGNAVKYVGTGGRIDIVITSNDNFINIEVCDNGIGIPEKDQQKIFMDFYRASNIKERNYEGAGLGLSVVKQIVEKHKGTIRLESPSKTGTETKPGTCFTISLPIERDQI
ncbi:MAG: HAMP domain-containing histidine kinase [Ignavibacteriaceae bacterium]|nr:HAMP domain-containing histidine kinase [Ignavibacteriaceae bacterium]